MPTNGWDLAPVKLEPGQKERWKAGAAFRGLSLAAYVRACVEETLALDMALRKQRAKDEYAQARGRERAFAESGVE